jgi:hypothetical protein
MGWANRQATKRNRITGHKSIMRDITDRHAAEKLIESEGQLQTIFNEAPDANCNRRSAKYY